MTHRERRALIRKLLLTNRVGTQEELGVLLKRQGVEVTQATVSRDLTKLKARRATLPGVGTVYELEDTPLSAGDDALRSVGHLVTMVDDGDAMVVIRTRPAAASVVAAAIDGARHPSVLGSVAGDDTVVVVPAKGIKPARLKRELHGLWLKGLSV
ncbi:MAG: arginine repressor [Archangium sp.]|nr:arginine repressor [Archangium sp.]